MTTYQYKAQIQDHKYDNETIELGWSKPYSFNSILIILKSLEKVYGINKVKYIQLHPVYTLKKRGGRG